MKALCKKYSKIVYNALAADSFTKTKTNKLCAYKEQREANHVLDMLILIQHMEPNSGKQNRWLGFVQGWLWTIGLRSIDEMRADVTEVMAIVEQAEAKERKRWEANKDKAYNRLMVALRTKPGKRVKVRKNTRRRRCPLK